MTFEKWMEVLDQILLYYFGISYKDLPDIEYLLLFEDGTTVREAAQIALNNAGHIAIVPTR